MITIERKMKVGGARRKGETFERVPRVAKLMALAIRFDQLIRDGVVADQAELARLGHVSRARVTQVMNLLNLAPDLQEKILFLQGPTRGRDQIAERDLRTIAAAKGWGRQRRLLLRLSLQKTDV